MLTRLILIAFVICPLLLHGTPDVSLQVQRFRSGTSSYIEVSLYIVGSSIKCAPDDQYGVEYMIIIKDANENIVKGDRFRLSNSGCPAKDLIDVKRFALEEGMYTLVVEMNDILDSLNSITIRQKTEIPVYASTSRLSDIELLSTIRPEVDDNSPLHKSGLYLEPLPFSYYYPSLHSLNLYIETYDADKLEGQPFIRYTIKPSTGDFPPPIVAYRKVKKESVAANVFQLDITKLISGPYSLEALLFDGNKQEIANQNTTFSRYNPEGDSIYIASGAMDLNTSFVTRIPDDSIDYYLKALAPVVNSADVDLMNTLLDKGNTKAKQFFIHRYWAEQAGKYAPQAFEAYMKVARVVDDNYRSGFGYGFETDRGHIFLKYGKPDDVLPVEDEPSAPPYEIWFYNSFPATHQNNVRFLFYNPSLARNGFTLLHSTAIGEVKNEKWEIELYRDATLETPGVNANKMGDNVYRNARKYFENY
ncbi:MAG: GWxTD domain-containing protein [Saprospiraceae bacterium]